MLLLFQYCTSHILIYIKINNLMQKQFCKKDSNPCQTWKKLICIYKFEYATKFKLKSILLFWYLDSLLEKDKSGLLFQINIA